MPCIPVAHAADWISLGLMLVPVAVLVCFYFILAGAHGDNEDSGVDDRER
ncbi:MAG: hypothetical protein WAO61_02985 [Solirubrobacterales bacterium]